MLDSTRCISYYTIEHRGHIPIDIRSGIGHWIFGCDICQDVCPWNRKAKETDDHEFASAMSEVHVGGCWPDLAGRVSGYVPAHACLADQIFRIPKKCSDRDGEFSAIQYRPCAGKLSGSRR